MQSDLISIHKATRSFPGDLNRGVFDVSLSINRGEIVCVIGPSGSGKSTLLRMLAGLENPDQGTVSLNREIAIPGEVVYVPQDYTLWPHLTVLENLILAPREVRGLPRAEIIEEAEILLARFGLEGYGSMYANELSGGQKQRVALLRALMMRPAILLLDEVTSALDPELTKGVLDTIRALAKDGYTMVVVTHHIPLALTIADRIVFLDEGRIIQDKKSQTFFQEQSNSRILSFIQGVAKKDHSIEIFEGTEQFQAYHMGLLKRLPEGAVIHVAGAVGDRWFEPMGTFAKTYTALRVAKKITWRMVAYELGEKDKEILKKYPEINDFRLMPRTLKNPANYNVMDGTVIIQIFGKHPTIMEIRDTAVAETYNTFFEEMWNVGKVVKS